ncbi:major facilitator superfamily protein [Stylonychia lemnae]|uniref:Major facilitator superfamily protein n=1 Tax=Stylonychia lemnae TaxID=5949 RepID=A0A078A608_STYLE|nr:major facilitator superfamily protein [Stylonychia lemnae]|eukprot:CDW77331.1 major facilitator superfamily protein [Stylonychia lemnae]
MQESPAQGSGQTMPQSHQELFGYYMNNVLERQDDDEDVFLVNDNNQKKRENKSNDINQQQMINNTTPAVINDSSSNNQASLVASKLKNFNAFQSQSSDPLVPYDPSKNSMGEEYKLYRYRFFNLALYCFAAMINQIAWISLQPVADAVSNAYDKDTTTVNTISLVYMGVYLLVLIGTMLTFAGMWIKVLVNEGFYILIIGQMISAIGQPFLTNAPAKVAAQWYATTIATASIPLGVAVGFVIPSIFVDNDDNLPQNKDNARDHIFNSLLCQAIIASVIAALILFFFREKPPTPPSPSAGVQKDPFWPSIRQLFYNKNVWLLVIIFGFVQGVFNTLGTVVGEISAQYDYGADAASLFGAIFIIGGIIGSACFGVWVEIKKTYKLSVIIISILSALSIVGVAFSFMTGLVWLSTLFCFIVGFSMIPIMAVGFELGVEVTYPIDESYSTGLLMFSGQLLGIIYVIHHSFTLNDLQTVISSELIKDYQKEGCLISEGIYVASLVVSIALSFFVKEDLRRQRQEKLKKDRDRDNATIKTQEIKYGGSRSQSGNEIEQYQENNE